MLTYLMKPDCHLHEIPFKKGGRGLSVWEVWPRSWFTAQTHSCTLQITSFPGDWLQPAAASNQLVWCFLLWVAGLPTHRFLGDMVRKRHFLPLRGAKEGNECSSFSSDRVERTDYSREFCIWDFGVGRGILIWGNHAAHALTSTPDQNQQ